MFARRQSITPVLLTLAFGSTTAAVSAPSVSAAPIAATTTIAFADDGESTVEPTTASLIADIHLPDGANRVMSGLNVAQFEKVLQQAAQSNQGKIASTEVLVWTGASAKTVVADVTRRLKDTGYILAQIDPIAGDDGMRVTPIAAVRGSESERLVGLWVETKDNEVVLVWGRLIPTNNLAAPQTVPGSPAVTAKRPAAPKPAAVIKKAAVSQKTNLTTKAKKSTKASTQARRTAPAPDKLSKAIKAYQDYQYVKFYAPISGSMYRSSKW